jgi:hypothetical protein
MIIRAIPTKIDSSAPVIGNVCPMTETDVPIPPLGGAGGGGQLSA